MFNEDPNLCINERMLLATMATNKEIYFAVKDLNLKDWFFRAPETLLIFKEMNQIIEQRTFDTYRPVLMGVRGDISKLFESLMKEDSTFYRDLWHEDDIVLINMINFYLKDSREQVFRTVTNKIEIRIIQNKPYQDLLTELESLQENFSKSDAMDCREIAAAIETEVQAEVYKTGLQQIDRIVEIVPGSLFVVAGESSSGKTAWACQMFYNFISYNEEYDGIIYSLETTQTRLGKRLERHIAFTHSCSNEGSHELFRDIGKRIQIISQVTELADIVKGIRDERKNNDRFKFVCIDYLQIITCDGIDEETPRVAKVVMKLHQLAQELGLVMILLCQLKKEEYTKTKGKQTRATPTMQSLRGSAQIVNSADVITINHFKEVTADNRSKFRDITIQVVKNKDGEQGAAKCKFNGEAMSFTDCQDED